MRQKLFRSDRIRIQKTTTLNSTLKYYLFYLCREAYSAAGIGDATVRGLGAVQYQRLELRLLLRGARTP
jgi:hypothetical protein